MIEEQNDALKKNIKPAIERYKFVIDCLKDKPRVIADLACGMGYGAYMLKQAGHYVAGYDKSIKAIDYAKDNYSNIFYNVVDLEKVVIDGFDVAVCLEMLCHLKNPQKFIDNIKMKELIISAPIDPDKDDRYIYRLHNLSELQFRNMFKDKWKIIKELKQKKYLILYLKKNYE